MQSLRRPSGGAAPAPRSKTASFGGWAERVCRSRSQDSKIQDNYDYHSFSRPDGGGEQKKGGRKVFERPVVDTSGMEKLQLHLAGRRGLLAIAWRRAEHCSMTSAVYRKRPPLPPNGLAKDDPLVDHSNLMWTSMDREGDWLLGIGREDFRAKNRKSRRFLSRKTIAITCHRLTIPFSLVCEIDMASISQA